MNTCQMPKCGRATTSRLRWREGGPWTEMWLCRRHMRRLLRVGMGHALRLGNPRMVWFYLRVWWWVWRGD